MFRLTHPKIFNTPSFSFEHPEGYRLAVLPSEGATIMDIMIEGKSILETYQTEQELKESSFYKNEILAPFPNRIRNGKYNWNNKTYQLPINNSEFQAALHGFVYNKSFEVLSNECTDQSCSITLLYQYEGEQTAFPFPFELQLKYTLNIEFGFQLDYEIRNTGTTNMPAGFGWHPYFTFGKRIDEVSLRLPTVKKIEVDENMIPTGVQSSFDDFEKAKKIGKTLFDTCFKVKEDTSVDQIQVSLEHNNNYIIYWQKKGIGQFNFLQLYIPPNRSSIAIEPMTCNINTFNNQEGLVVLEPKEKMSSSCGVHFYENLF